MDQDTVKQDLQNDLKRFMKLHKLKTLSAVKEIPVGELLKMPGFGYRILLEFVLAK